MKICTTEQEYINEIASSVQRVCKRYGYLPSVLIGQSCLENGYGIRSYWDNPQIEALLKYNNMVGIKSELLSESWEEYTVWTGESLTKKTPEVYNGKQVTIDDDFRKYDTIERSFADFLLFITYASNYGKGGTPKYGNAVTSIKDPETLIKKVKALGYATGTTYATNVMKIVNKHNLTKYDDLSNVTPTIYTPGYKGTSSINNTTKSNIVSIGKKTINDITSRNKSQVPASRGSNSIKFIVCHYLGVPNADNPDLYGGGYGGHYNIQRDGQIFMAANPKTAVVWQCGGGLQGSGGHSFYKVCTNYNSIGIECGVCYTDKSAKDGDGDNNKWYFTEATQESLVYLVSKLMDDYNIGIDHVIRHYDVTGKICPNPYVKNNGLNGNWTWDEFISNVKQYRKDGTITVPSRNSSTVIPTTTTKSSSVSKSYLQKGDKGDDVKTMQSMLIACGYSCGSCGADGDFGNGTLSALKAFQKDNNLTVDGLYGSKSKEALISLYNSKKNANNTDSVNTFLKSIKNVATIAKSNGWKYGDSHSVPPCSDKKISCDRLVARALYDLGYTDQPNGGITCNQFPTYLYNWGFVGTKKKSEIKSGAVVAVGKGDNIEHVFVVESYNPSTDICNKYDTGSDERIRNGAYYKNVKLVEWTNREFIAAWNVPSNLKSSSGTKEESAVSSTMFNGLDYSPVYNYSYYKNKYADLQKAFGADEDAYFKHFCTYGMKEGRQASSAFNVQKYKSRYSDLRKAFGNNLPLYFKHYLEFGISEKRNAK